MIATFLKNEEERLQELLKYKILDTPEERCFDDIVQLASQLCQAPISLITLVDNSRQWFKARLGVPAELKETSRDIAFCAHAIHFDKLLEVKDLLKDKRFADNPLVLNEPKIRFYAGIPLISPRGYKLGTLCVLDTRPRVLDPEQRFALDALAKQVMQQFELKLKNMKLAELAQQCLGFYEEGRVEHEVFEKVQEAAEIGKYEIYPQTGEMKVSDSFCLLFGLPKQKDFTLRQFLDLVYPPDIPHFRESFNKSLEQRLFSYEFRCIRPSGGELVYIKCMGETLKDSGGEPYKQLGIKQNVTPERQNEIQLAEQNQELKKVNEELDNFVYRVSHDLRAPNSSILGLIDIILHQEEDPEEIKKLLRLIKESLKKQDDFIKDILSYSKNARLELKVEPVDFHETLESIFSQLLYTSTGKVVRHIEVNQSRPFVTDKSRLNIVLNNLISNALKYLSPGRVPGKVSVHVQTTESEAHITIEDNGIGIEEKYLPRVFEMFYRATDQKPGSGLGLYIVKEAMQKLGGEISLQSEPGKGTRVKLTLPSQMGKEPI